jgi:hypothetical protein
MKKVGCLHDDIYVFGLRCEVVNNVLRPGYGIFPGFAGVTYKSCFFSVNEQAH